MTQRYPCPDLCHQQTSTCFLHRFRIKVYREDEREVNLEREIDRILHLDTIHLEFLVSLVSNIYKT